jgi:hypothetical protein
MERSQHMLHQFTVKFDSPRQAVLELLHVLSEHRVDLRSIGLCSIEGQTTAVFTTSDDVLTHEMLVERGIPFTEGEVVCTSVPDQPGALADVADRLFKADLNVYGVALLRWYQGKAELAISVDKPDQARQILAAGLQPAAGAHP